MRNKAVFDELTGWLEEQELEKSHRGHADVPGDGDGFDAGGEMFTTSWILTRFFAMLFVIFPVLVNVMFFDNQELTEKIVGVVGFLAVAGAVVYCWLGENEVHS